MEEKDAQPTERTRSLRWIVKQINSRIWVKLHKEWTEAGVMASRATTHGRVKECGYSCRQRRFTWAKEKKNWTVAQCPKSSFQMRASVVFNLETKVLESGGRGGEAHRPSWGAMSSAGIGPLCFLKTNITASVYQEFWSTSCFLLLTSF